MIKIVENNITTLQVDKTLQCVDVFDGISGSRKILVDKNVKFTYLLIIKSSEINIDISTVGSGCECEIFAIFVGDNKPIKSQLSTNINNPDVKINKYVLSLLGEGSHVDVDARINISKGVKNVVGHLLEENVVLGKKISIKTLPMLNVASKDVIASHGAKIERIDQNKLFYMTSKGLDYISSQKLVLDGYINNVLANFDKLNDEQLDTIKNFIKI